MEMSVLDACMRKNEETNNPCRAQFYAELLSDAYNFFARHYAEKAEENA